MSTQGRSRKPLTILILLLVTGAIAAFLLRSRPQPPVKPVEETAWLVDTQTLQHQTLAPQVTLLGTTESTGLALISSRINADVLETPYLNGARVQAGDELLILDTTDAQAQLSQREADVTELKARLDEENRRYESDLEALKQEESLVALAEKAVERQRKLIKSAVSSQERLEAAETALEQQRLSLSNRNLVIRNHPNRVAQLKAQLLRAEALLAVAQRDFAQTRLLAPFSGRITALHTAPGNRVRIGEPLIELLADNSLEVVAQIPNRWVASLQAALQPDRTVNAIATVFNQPVSLSLERLSARANDRTAGVNAYFKAPAESPLILGKSVDVTLTLPPLEGVYSAPLSALYGDNTLFLIRDERLQAVKIDRLGRYSEEEQEYLIFAGQSVQPGDVLLTTQLPNAITGLKVRLRDAATATGTDS